MRRFHNPHLILAVTFGFVIIISTIHTGLMAGSVEATPFPGVALNLNLADSFKVPTVYSDVLREQKLKQSIGMPLTLAAADFDEDGMPDLVSGYASQGGGVLTLHRGNVDAVYPNSPEAQQRKAEVGFTDFPFLPSAAIFEMPSEPAFMGAGDFDADGHWDVVVAARGGGALYYLRGDGKGHLRSAQRVYLPGRLITLAVGEVNRADGLIDVIAGISGPDGPKLLVFEGPEGSLTSKAAEVALPSEATALSLGHLNNDCFIDLAAAAGRDLLIIHGRDRKLSLDEMRRAEVPDPVISHQVIPFAIVSMALGNFSGDGGAELALLSDDGRVQIFRPEDARMRVSSEITLPNVASMLIPARISSLPHDDLLAVSRDSQHLRILANHSSAGEPLDRSADDAIRPGLLFASLDVEGEPVAVMPMRLNIHARDGLVLLKSRDVSPSVMLPKVSMTFTVTTTDDSGPGSLRQAIIDANNNPGADTINFQIGKNAQTIALTSSLPVITDAVTIDGTTQPGFMGNPIIEVTAPIFGERRGLIITAGNSTVRGLVLNRFSMAIRIETNGGNVVEGNFLGTDLTGTMSKSNGLAIQIFTSNNRIGGTVAAARNIISGNDSRGIAITQDSTRTGMGNIIQGNFFGTDVTGTTMVRNNGRGIEVTFSTNTLIGGTTAGARNIMAGHFGEAIVFSIAGGGNLVQGNFIGTDVNGNPVEIPVGIAYSNELGIGGIVGDNLIGGTTPAARNLISGNRNGIRIGTTNAGANLVQGNFIGTNVTGTARLGSRFDQDSGVNLNNARGVTVGGATAGARNIISGHRIVGVAIGPNSTENRIVGNFIGTDVSGTAGIPNPNGIAFDNFLGVNGNFIEGNTIAFNTGDGVFMPSGVRNSILANSIFANGDLGIDLGSPGVTPNDPGDPDTGANDLQNFPDLSSASTSANNTIVQGRLNSTRNSIFRLEFFSNTACDPSGFGEGESFIGSAVVTTDDSGNADFAFGFPVAVEAGRFITAMATDGFGNTSEFSRCVQVQPGFDLCLQDDGSGDMLQINSATGDYRIVRCDDNFTLAGTGRLTRRGSTITLQHFASDRRVLATVNVGLSRGFASVQIFSPRTTLTITDRNIGDSSCDCR
jgi:hypothetical protein